MPTKSNIELGNGTLYFNGSDEGIEVTGGGAYLHRGGTDGGGV